MNIKKLPLKNILTVLVIILIIGLALLWKKKPFFPKPFKIPVNIESTLISHGGPIDDHTYTNSYEALLLSVKNGYQLIEVDMMMSTDGIIFGAHDWKHFYAITGTTGEGIPLSYNQIVAKKYMENTPFLQQKNQ